MRPRLVVLACLMTAVGSVTAPSLASAAPRHNHHLTIAAAPNPVPSGDGVVIYGRLFGSSVSGQPIALYHHISGSGRGYTLVQTTTTDASGFYEFTRAEDVVTTNRSWFVRGPNGSHSRTVHERVNALVSMTPSGVSTDTSTPVTFTGSVSPLHPFERVVLQEQNGSSDDWSRIKSGFTDASSNYSISYRWRRPGAHDVRVVFPGDFRNIRGVSSPTTVVVQQAQVPDFTINTSSPIVDEGGAVTISGVLFMPGSTTAPDPNVVVQLWGRRAHQRHFFVLADATTGADGSYSFPQAGLTTNTVYHVATMRLPHTKRRHTSPLYQGVRDVLTFQASTTSATTGQTVTFTGTVLPDKAGHSIYLQKLGKDGDWDTVEARTVRHDSTFQFRWTIGAPGGHMFRARITADAANVGAGSAPVTVTAVAPPPSSLPPSS
jgi:hypothetical protein